MAGRPRKIKPEVELTTSNSSEIDKTISTEQIVELKVEEPVQPTIHDRYRILINKANSDYLNGYTYNDLIIILRYCEKKIGHQIPINLQCGSCVIDLIKLFGRLE